MVDIHEDCIKLIPTICCWYDLLGYGAPFVESSWNLRDPKCITNFQRIDKIGAWHWGVLSLPFGPRMVLNDGMAACMDIPDNLNDVYLFLTYFESIINDYDHIRGIDQASGYPGVRGVISCGDRYEYEYSDTGISITSSAERPKTVFYHPREFQMNTAFSKAFIIEESGSKAGVSGSNLYVDQNVFSMLDSLLKKCDGSVSSKTDNDRIVYTLTYNNEWFATISFFKETVSYNFKGIQTVLLRFDEIHSLPEELANEAAYLEGRRIAQMEQDMEDEDY
ncbi:hypothetical protein B0O40_0400 [Ruminococcaceae bacterium R-25]|nr:hypothetical protein B0O40_0400 [Ruminococcaceae bacterium R-25]SUQ11037.1 hypothetical protein SAMN06297423_0400 [Oscillospiraceae bacterium]